jgi:hypothetical protein
LASRSNERELFVVERGNHREYVVRSHGAPINLSVSSRITE